MKIILDQIYCNILKLNSINWGEIKGEVLYV